MTRIIRIGVAMTAVAAFAIAGCGSSKKSTSTTAAAATTVAAATTTAGAATATTAVAGAATTVASGASTASTTQDIAIQSFKYVIPAGLKAGATITIVNGDSAAHTFTDKDGKFDIKVAGSGGQATITLPAAGTYSIICKIHSSMSGTLTVV